MSEGRNRKTVLIISQVFVPDPASVGQHMADVAQEMSARGQRVIVFTANRGYDDPGRKYVSRETRNGVEIRRLPLSSFGKTRMSLRFIAAWLFVLQCTIRGLFMRRLDTLLVSTSPPMAPFAGIVIGWLRRRVRIVFWCMDLNIDLLVAMGRASRWSPVVRFFGWMERAILRRANHVVALDRYMADRLNAKLDVHDKMTVIAPWPHEDHVAPVEHTDNPFRREHGIEDKFVIMFSGNLTVAADVDTILEAALKLQDDSRLLVMFIGGGSGKKRVEQLIAEKRPRNIVSLPYQPLERLRFSLSAADVHLVSVGDILVGLSHPCKVYGAMTVARPILLLGPTPSHVADILGAHGCGWQIAHGDVDEAERTIRRILDTPPHDLREMGQRARQAVQEHFAMNRLRANFCDLLMNGN
jgi:colanic acid biosynthesis glycosyl transferase WcaI